MSPKARRWGSFISVSPAPRTRHIGGALGVLTGRASLPDLSLCVHWGKGGQHRWPVHFTPPGSFSSGLRKNGPFLMSCVLNRFFFPRINPPEQEEPREGLGFRMESTSGFKGQREKPFHAEFPAIWYLLRSLFSEQASPEYLGKCL